MTTEEINDLLDEMRTALGFKSDAQLARYLDVQPITVWRWRQGHLDTTKQKLLAYLLKRNAAAVEVL
jgi:hypothetical protein